VSIARRKFEMMRAIGFDYVIDYRKENFARNGRRYDLILDTKTTRSPFAYTRSLNSEGTYATVGGKRVPTVAVSNFRMVHSENHWQNRPLDHAEAETGSFISERTFLKPDI